MLITRDRVKKVLALAALVSMAVLVTGHSKASTATASAADAAATFKAKCATCHGADGGGNTPAGKGLKVKDLRSAEVQGLSDAQLLEVISKGKGKMPAYEKSLGADTCKALVAYIRTLK